MNQKPLAVAWISDFPIEWLPNLPDSLRNLPRRHPATWQMVLLSEFEKNPDLQIHIVLLRTRIKQSLSFERNGVSFHVLKAASWLRLASAFWLDTVLLRRVCRQAQIDLVHAWGSEHGAASIAQRLGMPCLITVQGLFAWYKEKVGLSPYFKLMERFERASFKRATVATTESKFAVRFLRERYPHLRVHQAEHAPNHLFFNVRREPQTAPARFLCIGTLGFRKGTDILFSCLEQLRHEFPFELTVISNPDPAYIASLKRTASAELWNRTEFKHHILPDEVARELERPLMMLLPTRADTSPNAAKEAVVAGVPVIASNVGGIPDYVFPGKNGMLFEPGSVAAFVNALRSALANPLFSQGKVDPSTLSCTRDYLSPGRMAENFLTAYAAALKSA